jgi:hypothetical protein
MKFVSLTAIDTRKEAAWIRSRQAANDSSVRLVEIEEDDLEQPASRDPDEADDAPDMPQDATPGLEPAGLYFPVDINIEDLREYYPRKAGKTGTRLVFRNGAARPVKELYNDVRLAIAAA